MNIQSFCELMNRIAPPERAMEGDRIGLLIGPEKTEIRRVLAALDLTVDVAEEAIRGNFDMVLTHHPIFWDPITEIRPDRFETAAAYRLIRHGIGMFAAHTNLDAAPGGVNDVLANMLHLEQVCPLPPENLGRIGILREPMRFYDFITLCEKSFDTRSRIVGNPDDVIRTVAVIGGAGGGDVAFVKDAGCDAFVTGEMKHHQALEAAFYRLHCCVLGHYETENIVLKPLINRLQNENSDVQYFLAQSGKAPLPYPQGGNRNE